MGSKSRIYKEEGNVYNNTMVHGGRRQNQLPPSLVFIMTPIVLVTFLFPYRDIMTKATYKIVYRGSWFQRPFIHNHYNGENGSKWADMTLEQ